MFSSDLEAPRELFGARAVGRCGALLLGPRLLFTDLSGRTSIQVSIHTFADSCSLAKNPVVSSGPSQTP